MDLQLIIDFLVHQFPILVGIFSLAGSIVTVIRAKVKATESNEDDTALANLEAKPLIGLLLKAVEKFSVLKLKE